MSSNSEKTYSIENPGFLKLDLLTKGISLDESAKQSTEIKRIEAVSKSLGIMPEIDIVLPGQVVVNVDFKKKAQNTPYLLIKDANSFYVTSNNEKVGVTVLAPPAYYDKKAASGVALAKIGRLYGEYLVVSPTIECEFLTKDLACFYCDVRARVDRKRTVDEVIETIAQASKDNQVRMVCLNTGYLATPDGGITELEPYIKEIKKSFNTLVAVQAQPPLENEWIDYTYALGVDSLAYNLEVYDPDIFAKIAPGKKKMIGRERYIEAIRRAALVFPRGGVVSNLIVGLEPIDSTIKGINALSSMGVIPTLPIIRHSPDLGSDWHAPTAEEVAKVFLHLNKTLRRVKLSDSWISHSNIAMNAIDGRYFGGDAPYKSPLGNIFKSKKGAKLALNLAKMRRSLRVRKVKDEHSRST